MVPCVCKPLCVRDRFAPDASGANLSASGGSRLTVKNQRVWFKRLTRAYSSAPNAEFVYLVVTGCAFGGPVFCSVKEPTTLFV